MSADADGSATVLNSGVPIHHYVLKESAYADSFDSLSVRFLSETNLADVRILVIPYKTNQEILRSEQQRLEEYVRAGGTLIAFGDAFRQWLPGGNWRPVEFDYTWWARGETLELEVLEPEHPLFEGVSSDVYTWHYHGRFDPPTDATPLLAAPEGVVMYEQHLGAGRLLATTIDPVHHLGDGQITNPIDTTSALDRILEWAAECESSTDR
ncbi:MAG: hypothetical protein ABEH78_06965 [Haloferacaceae archaeon]